MAQIAFDTMVAAHLLNEELSVSLLNVAGVELGISNWGKGKQSFGEGTRPVSELFNEAGEGLLEYCMRDTGYAHMLYEIQKEKLLEQQHIARLYKYLVLPGLAAVGQMEHNGIWVDPERLRLREQEWVAQRDQLAVQLLEFLPEMFREAADFGNDNFNRKWLFGPKPGGLGITPHRRFVTPKTKQPQMNDEHLALLDHPAVSLLRDYKSATKALQFFEQWRDWADPDSRVHPYFNLTGAVTGRRSCSNPNLQQVPRESTAAGLRSCFGAPPGWLFLEVDYAAIEVRVMAWFANDLALLEMFKNGRDPYKEIAAEVLHKAVADITKDERQKGKAAVLGFLYGMGENGFVEYARSTYQVEFTPAEAKAFRDTFFGLFPDVLRFHEKMKRIAHKNLQVESPTGRVRHLLGVLSVNGYLRGRAERQAINSTIQGFGGDLALMSVVELHEKLPADEVLIVGDIHDAVLFQIREGVWEKWTKFILQTMERPQLFKSFGIDPPIRLTAEGKIGHYWAEPMLPEFTLDHASGELVDKNGLKVTA